MRPISSRFALPVALICLLSCKGSESSTGPSGGFAPTSNATVNGNVTYTSVNIPAGVTVTFTADAVVTVSGDYTQAGNVSAPCHSLTLAVTGNVTITGAVANDCSDPNADGTPLRIVGQTSYALTNATITSSGDVSIVNDPGRTLSASITPFDAPTSAAAVPGIAAQASSGSYRCNYTGSNITTTPPKRKKGANGSPAGANGAAGAAKYLNCGYASSGTSGGSMLLSGTTITGGSGGDGGDGTSASSTPSQGGDGGPPGVINISADNDIVLNGTVNINGGNGGKGGTATSTGAAGNPGVTVTANGGKGGGLKPASGAAPVSMLAKGSITQSGTLNFTLGAAGAGGDAIANAGSGLPGNPGARGGDATANGGNGGASTPVTMNATGATALNGTVNLVGGAGGAGGASNPSPGNGGDGNAAGASGGRGGDAFGRGGTGGVGNPPGALASSKSVSAAILASLTLNSPGGNGGDANLTNADGGAGQPGCPSLQGGNGGGGGNANGGDGPGGAGTPTGNHGHTTITGFGNGNNGAAGAPPGALGPAGTDNTTVSAGSGAAKTVTNSFKPGLPGGPCPGSFSMTVTPPTQTASQGGTGSVHVVITRNNGFTGAVTLTVTDQSGASHGTGTIATSSTSTDVTFTVPSNATVGANTWTVTGTGTAVANVTQTFAVTVSQSTGTTASVQYCGAGTMVWAGFINGASGTPQNIPIVNAVATFTMTQPAAIYATTIFSGGTYKTDEYWGATTDVASWAAGYCNSTKQGSTTQSAIVRGLSTGQFSQATIGFASGFASQSGMGDLSFTIQNLSPGTSDGFATVSFGTTLQEMLILRNVVIPSASPVLFDFNNGFNPSTFQVLYPNDATRTISGNTFFWSPTGPLDALIGSFTASGGTGTFNSVPASRMSSTDLVGLNFFSSSGDNSDVRGITNYFHTPGNMSVTFPGVLNLNVSRFTTSAPVRLQATGTLPSGLNASYLLTASQGNNTESWYFASSFPGFGPTFNWTTPDWTSAGFQASWGMQPGSSIVVGGFAYGYTGGTLPADGAQRAFSSRTLSLP